MRSVPHRRTLSAGLIIIAVIGTTLTTSANGQQTTYHVDGLNGLTVQQGATGETWPLAYKYLKDALDDIGENPAQLTQVRVRGRKQADGSPIVYHPDRDSLNPSGTGDRNLSFSLRTNLAIFGGYKGTEPAPDTRDVPREATLDPAAVAQVIVECVRGLRDAASGSTILLPSP